MEKPTFLKRKAALKVTFCVKKTRDASHRKISAILRKAEHDRTEEESQYLCSGDRVVQEIKEKLLKRQRLKDRLQEFEDPPEVLKEKCGRLAQAISQSRHLVVYTGAGISTAARIPDYRGSNGVWTLLEQGKDIGLHDLSRAKPTLTHMALFKLYKERVLKHIVSQNCDGLHLRSGVPRSALSEIHGNMFLEVCHDCKPIRFYLRLFDVTQHTARFSHETLRLCYYCGSPLCDTIVHFGERGVLQWPLNWKTASDNANEADVILCLGSSLKVLKKYPWLWGMDKPLRKRPQLFIVNLQWTPKDEQATLKINGKCDAVLQQVMDLLNLQIPKYQRALDPIYNHATLIHPAESHTTSKPSLKFPRSLFLDLSSDNQKFLLENKLINSYSSSDPLTALDNVNAKIKLENSSAEVDEAEDLDLLLSVECDDSYDPLAIKREDADVHINNSVIMNRIIINESNFGLCKVVKEEEESIKVDIWRPMENSSGAVAGLVAKEELVFCNSAKEQVDSESVVLFDYEFTGFENVDLALGAVETVGISIPVDDFDHMYSRIRENLIAESKQTDTADNGNASIKDKSVIISGNICDTLQIQDTHSLKKTDRIYDSSSSDEDCDPVFYYESIASFDKAISTSRKTCNFCLLNYNSSICLFYAKSTNINSNFKERCCLCCESAGDGIAKERANSLDKMNQPNTINPGWFGKGCRKKIKKKKRD